MDSEQFQTIADGSEASSDDIGFSEAFWCVLIDYQIFLEVLRDSITLWGWFEVFGGALIDSEWFWRVYER